MDGYAVIIAGELKTVKNRKGCPLTAFSPVTTGN